MKTRIYTSTAGAWIRVNPDRSVSLCPAWAYMPQSITRKAAADALRSARREGLLFRGVPSVMARKARVRAPLTK